MKMIIDSIILVIRRTAYYKALLCSLAMSAVLLQTPSIFAQSSDVRNLAFEHITVNDGLSQNYVECILQDSKGFLWFGTRDGLNRYDGYDFKVYTYNAADTSSISANAIHAIYEDSHGNIWIGTFDGGLNQYDRTTNRFVHYQLDTKDPHSLSHNYVRAIHEDQHGKLWIGTQHGLNRFDPKTRRFTRFFYKPDDPAYRNYNQIRTIFETADGKLWLGTAHRQGGLLFFDPVTGSFTTFEMDPRWNNTITSLHKDARGNLWASAFSGLYRIDFQGWHLSNSGNASLDSSHVSLHDWLFRVADSPQEIYAICEDDEGRLWLGATGGLFIHHMNRGEIRHVPNDPHNPYSPSRIGINAVFKDRSGVMWLGTQGQGIDKLKRARQRIGSLAQDPDNVNSLSSQSIRSIYEDRDSTLWIGGYGGLDQFDRKTGRFTHVPIRPTKGSFGNYPWTIYEDPLHAGEIFWIGAEGGGLYRFDQNTQKLQNYRIPSKDSFSFRDNFVLSIYRDLSETLWVGTEVGLNKFDERSETFKQYNFSDENPGELSRSFVLSIREFRYDDSKTSDGSKALPDKSVLLLATERGLNCFDPATERFTHFLHDPRNPRSISNNVINCIHQDRAGRWWIGTADGLNRLILSTGDAAKPPTPEDATFIHYFRKDGLPNDYINGILEDEEGNLWLSTNRGISKFNPETETFRNYDVSDGLQSNEFNRAAYYQCRHGEMFFGSINGLSMFFPQALKNNPNLPQVVITDFKIFNKPVGLSTAGATPLNKVITETDEIRLSYKDNMFSFEFAALEYTEPEKNQYAYKMEGFDRDWIKIGTKREAVYTHLDPGEYIFRVKGSNNDGVWNEKDTSVKVIISPPFWRTWWFIAFSVLLLGIVVYGGHRFRIKSLKARNQALRTEITERQLAEANLQKAFAEIENLKDRLQAEADYLQTEIKVNYRHGEIIGESTAIKQMLGQVEQVAATDSSVFIHGETGTGKELVARAIHNLSPRHARAMVTVNCASLPSPLVESELFGREKGAYTGAMTRQIGRFEVADNSTIFLDEIGELSLEMQSKLLRVLQEGEFERLGSPKTIKVDVRVIAATNRDLAVEVRQSNFREDLFYRLNVFPIQVPPLRERPEDIPLLVWAFITELSDKMGKRIQVVPKKTMESLQHYHWPGNIRELRNVIEHAMIVSPETTLQINLPVLLGESKSTISSLEQVEIEHIMQVLEKTNWRIKGHGGAAELLGLNPGTLYSKMRKLSIPNRREKVDNPTKG